MTISWRIRFGRFLIRLGSFIRSLAVIAMKPRDLVQFNYLSFSSPGSIEEYSEEQTLDWGLLADEQELFARVPMKQGRIAILGVGGGRMAIPLAKMGHDVTGIDFVPAMVQRALENAEKRGVRIHGVIQDFTALELGTDRFDMIWFPAMLYSYIPTRKWRIEVLSRIWRSLKPGGHVLCRFMYGGPKLIDARKKTVKKIIALLFFGNRGYERGDILWNQSREFLHMFSAENELTSEFREAGFQTVHIAVKHDIRGEAILRKPNDP
ncbi:MAG: class I SAM-dependent methyltransferase [Candidatus Aminicenantes bacterium]|nr:class I SAM-dependent methyltransferase [Candidatus Aminicenantes bacterium]